MIDLFHIVYDNELEMVVEMGSNIISNPNNAHLSKIKILKVLECSLVNHENICVLYDSKNSYTFSFDLSYIKNTHKYFNLIVY